MFCRNTHTYTAIVILILGMLSAAACSKEEPEEIQEKPLVRSGEISRITVGETSGLEEYRIVCEKEGRDVASLLQELICGVCGAEPEIIREPSGGKEISIALGEENAIRIRDGRIEICGVDWKACEEYVYYFANTYLGYAFAGDPRRHILTTNTVLRIPEDLQECEDPWMKEREPIICLWKTNTARGAFQDMNVSLKSELLSYSDDQLYEYVKMMKYFGFTGIQVTDMCSAWAQYGGYEFVQDRIRFMADAAHSLGMKFTLWVWGAEFDGYGWVDNSVLYHDFDVALYSKDAPRVVETFDKYYSIYAQLADCSDRVIMHFHDPGQLGNSLDIGYFAKMLREKCLLANPELDFGISCYTYQVELDQIQEFLGNDVTVYSGIIHQDEDYEKCMEFRTEASELGYPIGIWSWNLTEMEIDQLAEMNVNARLIADCYRRTSCLDDIYRPEYWSEMDSYHMANLFSLYCAGQLLQDPHSDPDELLYRISEAVVGGEYAEDLWEVLSIIQDARSGEDWSEFRIGCDNYLLESDRYQANLIYGRCERAIPKLEEMIRADLDRASVPLAISTGDLLSMILPQLVQIREFAKFRVLLDELWGMYEAGELPEVLQFVLNENYKSIPEYNTVVGVWGQAEARAQYNLVTDFCERTGLEAPVDAGFEYLRRQRLLGEMTVNQKRSRTVVTFPKYVANHWKIGFGEKAAVRLVEEMLAEGILTENEYGEVYLTDWENYRYDF